MKSVFLDRVKCLELNLFVDGQNRTSSVLIVAEYSERETHKGGTPAEWQVSQQVQLWTRV